MTSERVASVATGLGMTAAAAVGYSDLHAVVYGIPGAPVLAAGATEVMHRRDANRSAAQNSFYFLYAADRQLASPFSQSACRIAV